MLSITGFQPQLLAPMCQLTSVWRSLQSAASAGFGKHTPRKEISSELVIKGTLQDGQKLGDLKGDLEKQFEELGLKELTEGLRVQKISLSELQPKLLQVAPTGGFAECSHMSAHSFFANKTGFTEEELQAAAYRQAVTIHLPKFGQLTQKLHTQYIPQSVFLQCQRGFKTRRSTVQGFNVTGEERQVNQKTWTQGQAKTEPKRDALQQMLAEYKDDPAVQEKMKQAFAEGYFSKTADSDGQRVPKYKKLLLRIGLMSLSVLLILSLIQFLYKVAQGSLKVLSMNNEVQPINPENISVTFKDVKGADEAKQELEDVVHFLREPDKFRSLGAKLPKGILLVGSPGLGKTLLARAVAGEAGVPFFQTSGSEFDEMFVGTGARRVRSLFEAAKARAPCVIFIDEIDSVGAKRSNSQIHPYANQTINQFLAELDGFNQNEGIIVLGATNRRDQLDKALLRPGRFDVEVRVFPPDLKGRTEMFEHYMSKIKYDKEVKPDKLAQSTRGCTGADIENIVNQAALKAVLDGASEVTTEHFEHARDKVFMGPAKKSKIPDDETNMRTAYHEAGHTVVAYFTKGATPLYKVTILPRGMSLGHTSFVPDKEQYDFTKTQLLAWMDVGMGGRVAEEIMFGTDMVTAGASNDFANATQIASSMVKQYGMSEEVGVRSFKEGKTDGGGMINDLLDKEIKRLLQESYDRAKAVLKTHQKELRNLAEALVKYETLNKDEVALVMKGKALNKPEPKNKNSKTSKNDSDTRKIALEQDSNITFCTVTNEKK